MAVIIDDAACIGCGFCVDACSSGVLEVEDDVAKVVNADACGGCGECKEACPQDAITLP